jgi:hypothetical protein
VLVEDHSYVELLFSDADGHEAWEPQTLVPQFADEKVLLLDLFLQSQRASGIMLLCRKFGLINAR